MLLKLTLFTALILLSYLTSFSQAGFPYNTEWKRIDSLMNQKNLPKSALAEVNKVYTAAKKDSNEAQWVKAIIYKNHLQEAEDQSIGQQMRELENEISLAPPRVAALLKSVKAEQLNRYGLEMDYKFHNRTDIAQDTSTDISTWTTNRINQKVRDLYLSSLENPVLLQKTNLEPFDPILIPGNSRDLRPTLFDLLSWRALDYFQSAPTSVTNDSLSYNPYLFSEAPFFMHLGFSNADSISNTLNALKIYQQLLRFHAKDIPADAWIDANNHRIQFVNQYSNLPDKDSLYLNALRRITSQYPSFSASTQSWYLQAKFWSDKASTYQPLGDTSNRYDFLKAVTLCNQAVKYHDSSEGKSNAVELLREINRQHFSLTVEGVNIPDQPFRALITYKNISYLEGRIIPIDEATKQSLDKTGMDVKSWNKLIRMPFINTFRQAMPETSDYQQHSAEIKIGALPAGQYILLTSSDSAFNDRSMLCMTRFFSSSIAFVKNGIDYFVLDRDSGHPLKGVKIKSSIYKNVRGEYQYASAGYYISDINGHFKLLIKDEQYSSVKLEFSSGKDYFSSEDYINYSRSYNNDDDDKDDDKKEFEEDHLKDYLFTDRAIYRPGQTVFFKGLLITKEFKTRRFKPVKDKTTTIFLKDANDQKIDSLILKSNEFGSIHGSFRLPTGLLNGEFSLYDGENEGDINFSVEEYKRPSFYVELDSVGGTYSVGDTIAAKGSATAYAGNTINAATVSWRVTRASRFPYPWMFRFYPSKSTSEIASGTTQTDANGQFSIRFPAIADPSVSKSSNPIYNYQIETTVTDNSGETRSATSTVSVSYHSFQIISSLAQQSRMLADSLQQIPVITRNLAGSFIPEKLTVSVSALRGPSRLIRKRYWQQPDQFVMSEPDYIRFFPHDEYQNESDIKYWKQGPVIWEKTDSTNSRGLFNIDRKQLESLKPGWYVLEFKVYDKSDLVSDKRYIEITGNTSASHSSTYNIIPEEDVTTEPDKVVSVNTGSEAENIFVIRAKQQLVDSLTSFSFYGLSQEIKKSTVEVRESDRGGFALNDVFVKNNRWYTSQHNIRVPWTNKELQISYLTWKNKTLPGAKEAWKIKITGNKKDQAAAEILTAAYDASLDQFKPQSWSVPELYPIYFGNNEWNNGLNGIDFKEANSDLREDNGIKIPIPYEEVYDRLLTFQSANYPRMLQGRVSGINVANQMQFSSPMVVVGYSVAKSKKKTDESDKLQNEQESPDKNAPTDNIQIRKNFNETAFFQPDLKTDAQGNVEIKFTMPDALTKWKWMILANTKDLAFGYAEKTFVTQKELMVQTNMPRFFRAGDTMLLPVKIANLSTKDLKGVVQLEFLDAGNNQNMDTVLGNLKSNMPFNVNASLSGTVFFSTIIPAHFNQPLLYRVTANADIKGTDNSDGEENIIPVLSKQMLVTETLPLNMDDREEQHFTFDKLLKSGTSSSLQNQSLTVEFTTNPAWYAVQSLPYLMEFPYECAEQTFNRFYANALAGHIVKISPAMQAVFEKWKNTDNAALLSNLQKNEDLKSVFLQETPWVLQAQSETQQKKNLALLFDMIRMRGALKSALDKLEQMQSESGAFAWFKGGRDDRYITQYVISGIGKLKKLNAIQPELMSQLNKITGSAIAYLDKEIKSDFETRNKFPIDQSLGSIQIQYLYARSFFPENKIPAATSGAFAYYKSQATEKWMKQSVYMQAMISLFLNRTGNSKTANDILASLQENATQTTATGMYWKSVSNGYYWQDASVETQSLLIETFQEMKADKKIIDQMKYWLLEQKHTSHWPTTKATADACYALLLDGSDWLANSQTVSIQLGTYQVNSADEKTEAGIGYFQKQIPGDQIKPEMGNIEVNIKNVQTSTPNAQRPTPNDGLPTPNTQRSTPSYGAIYWQYFEDLDKITAAQTPLSISKKLFIEKNSNTGPVLEAVSEKNGLRPGDKLTMRIIIKSDRDLEYVHLKDMRAACLEPVNVLSSYKWQDGLGYYETTKDASTSFFFDRLPKGTYVFEYPVFVTTAGNYSNGISELECMYAPEFAAHSEGIRIHVESK